MAAKEIVKLIVGNNFRSFEFRPTQPSSSGTSKASLAKAKLPKIIDSQTKKLEGTHKELDNTHVELCNTCNELKICLIELNVTCWNLGNCKSIVTPQIPPGTALHTNNHLHHESTNKIQK